MIARAVTAASWIGPMIAYSPMMLLRLVVVFVVGACLGSLVNWAIYALAWHPRPISPWSRLPAGWRRRARRLDRVPIIGWLALRREAAVHGRGFWIRPLLIGDWLRRRRWRRCTGGKSSGSGLIAGQVGVRDGTAAVAGSFAVRQPRAAVVLDAGRVVHRHRREDHSGRDHGDRHAAWACAGDARADVAVAARGRAAGAAGRRLRAQCGRRRTGDGPKGDRCGWSR